VADGVNVLLEGAPSHINVAAVEEAMRTMAGVRAVPDLHIWTITSGRRAVTAHMSINDASESYRILREVREMLAERFALTHSTIQVEDPTFDTVVIFKKKD
jgi:cobalt-zinc-cadmium efflux system protein